MENEFEVEKILGKRTKRNGQILYHLKWKGFPESENTWEPLKNLNCPAKIAQFERAEKSKSNGFDPKCRTTKARKVYPTSKQKIQAGNEGKLNNNSQVKNKENNLTVEVNINDDKNIEINLNKTGKNKMSAGSTENTVEFGTPDLTSTLQDDMLDLNFTPNNSEHSEMSAHQPNLGTDGRDASTSNSHLGHGSKHAVDGQSSPKSEIDNITDESCTSEDDIVFTHKKKRANLESERESSFEIHFRKKSFLSRKKNNSSIQSDKQNEEEKMPPITKLGFFDIKNGCNNGTIGILDENPNDSIQKLYCVETKKEICGYFTCTWCGSILKYISYSYCDSLTRHRLNCGAPLEQKISISPTNFRSLISDIMNFVVDYGTVDITEIVIPKNMNKNNCNELINNMSDMKQK